MSTSVLGRDEIVAITDLRSRLAITAFQRGLDLISTSFDAMESLIIAAQAEWQSASTAQTIR